MTTTTLRNLLVVPQFNASNQIIGAGITRYLDRDGYRSTSAGTVADLTPEAQAAFLAVVHHAQQLRTDDERISQVFGELLAPVPDQTHAEQQDYTDPETGETRQQTVTIVDSYRQHIGLAITLEKLDNPGQRTLSVQTEGLSQQAREAVLALWRLLSL
jgi:hypothetical protein